MVPLASPAQTPPQRRRGTVEQCSGSPAASPMAAGGDELSVAMRRYVKGPRPGRFAGRAAATAVAASAPRRRAPRTHLHAELLRKRRDPAPSPKLEVRRALEALGASEGDAALEALLARTGEE